MFRLVVSLYHLLELFLNENESFRHCLAEPRQPRKKNTPYFLDLAGVKFLLKKERVFFFRGSALQVFGQVAEQCGLGFAKTIFWGKGFGKTSAEFPRPQKGVWGMNAGGFRTGGFRKFGGYKIE